MQYIASLDMSSAWLAAEWVGLNWLRLLSIIFSCIIIYALMVGIVDERRTASAASASTFYKISEVTSPALHKAICIFFGGSVSLLYAAIAFDAGSLLTALKKLLQSYIIRNFAENQQYQISQVLDLTPKWLEPLFVLIVFLIFFLAKIKLLMVFYRDVIINASGLYSIIDDGALETARLLMASCHNDFGLASGKLAEKYGEIPLPETLLNERNERRLAYQLVWANRRWISKFGFVKANEHQRKELNLPYENDRKIGLNFVYLGASIVVFGVMSTLYIVIIPNLSPIFANLHIGWPDPTLDGWSALIRYSLKNTLSLAFPLMLGINMYPIRRMAYKRRESGLQTFTVVAVVQFIFSFVVQEIFNVLDLSVAMARDQNYNMEMPRIHVSALVYSFAPCLAYAIVLASRKRKLSVVIMAAFTALSVGIWFGLCDLLYECYLPKFDYFFVYQSLLGLFVTVSFFTAAFLSGTISVSPKRLKAELP